MGVKRGGVAKLEAAEGSGEVSQQPVSLKKKKKPATALSVQRLDPLWQLLDQKIGGREGLLAAALSSQNPKAYDLVQLLLDKAHRTWGTKALAKKAGISAPEVVDMFRDKKWLEATLAIHEELPNIVQDAAMDAKASMVPCENCKGTKLDSVGQPCYVCRGKGELRRPGDKDKLSFVGEAAGMTGKRGPAMQTNIQINTPSGSNTSFEDLMKKAVVNVTKPKVIEVIAIADQDPED